MEIVTITSDNLINTLYISTKTIEFCNTYSLHFRRNIASKAPKSSTPMDEATRTTNHVSPIPDQTSRSKTKYLIITGWVSIISFFQN